MFFSKVRFKIIFFIAHFVIVCNSHAYDPSLPTRLANIIKASSLDSEKIGFSLVQMTNGKELFSSNSNKKLIPASIQKLFTTYVALKEIGADYEFPTEVFISSKDSPQPNVFIRAYGDPSFTSLDMIRLSMAIKYAGIKRINNVILDNTLFKNPLAASGNKAYQAANTSIAVNHNAFRVLIFPGVIGDKAEVSLTPGLSYKLFNSVKTLSYKDKEISVNFSPPSNTYNPNSYGVRKGAYYAIPKDPVKVNVSGRISKTSEQVEIYKAVRNPIKYYADLLAYSLNLVGVSVGGEFLAGQTPASSTLLHIHKSKKLKHILADMNHFSSNYIAGQILYAIGQDDKGYFDRNIGLSSLSSNLKSIGIDDVQIDDASGLSRKNQVSANSVTSLLLSAYRDFSIYPDFISSFSRFGNSGTLKKRILYKGRSNLENSFDYKNSLRANSVWAKTGTLNNVSSLAGYLEDRDGQRFAFCIIINANTSKDRAKKLENALIKEVAYLP